MKNKILILNLIFLILFAFNLKILAPTGPEGKEDIAKKNAEEVAKKEEAKKTEAWQNGLLKEQIETLRP